MAKFPGRTGVPLRCAGHDPIRRTLDFFALFGLVGHPKALSPPITFEQRPSEPVVDRTHRPAALAGIARTRTFTRAGHHGFQLQHWRARYFLREPTCGHALGAQSAIGSARASFARSPAGQLGHSFHFPSHATRRATRLRLFWRRLHAPNSPHFARHPFGCQQNIGGGCRPNAGAPQKRHRRAHLPLVGAHCWPCFVQHFSGLFGGGCGTHAPHQPNLGTHTRRQTPVHTLAPGAIAAHLTIATPGCDCSSAR